MKRLPLVLLWILVLGWSAWSAAALAIDGPFADAAAAKALAGAWLLVVAVLFFAMKPRTRALVVVAVLDALVTTWWLAIPPSNDRAWLPDVANLASADIDGDIVHVHNVRDFRYHTSDTDFTPQWEDRTYDLSKIRAADLFISSWGAPMIVHTIMSWEFTDGQHLAVSIETRKEKGEEYSAVLGFFRQFELYYVVADERDLIGVRVDHRGETVSLYRLSARPEAARELLVEYLDNINGLVAQPKWYNALTQNCTTTIVENARHVNPNFGWDWRILANGSLDGLLYLRGSIDNSIPFEELRRRSDVTEAAKQAGAAEDFSARIRRGLPRMPESSGDVSLPAATREGSGGRGNE
jgi:hypothetical protein